ncbi:3-phenylpropionate/cinnamic acid dioxygenase subunit beta [Euzebya sp.]|uniref:3-phenylpropionate/cinnamic acid dioxygenase subunit beta n=1 Tax=Euzebya sp. TaxID=1971409 RepID=UPI0035152DF3
MTFDTTDLDAHHVRIPGADERHHRVVDFLVDEAALLDRRAHHEWLALLEPDIRYLVPVRVTTGHTLATSTSAMSHFDEDMYSLRKRVERFDTEHAWAEDPPSRTRRHLSGIRCWQTGDDAVTAISNLLLFRSRGDVHEPDLISCARRDLLRQVDGALRLAHREVWLDESVLRTQNLAVFL